MKNAFSVLLCFVLYFSIHNESKAQIWPKQQLGIDSLFTKWSNNNSPGAAIAIVQNGGIAYKAGYGIANLEYNIPVTPRTVFHIASVSKQFTAFAVLLLENEGKLSIDDDIRKYIPEVPDFGEKITLKHLVHHTSGIRDQWNLLAMAGWRLDDVITKEHILKLVAKQKDLNFKPGEKYMYCNTGFTLLAEVVARVSGQSFAEYTKQNIFKPLKMNSTLFYDNHEKIVKNRAYSYKGFRNSPIKSVLSYANVGATSLFTTVEDISLWAVNFEEPVVGNQQIFSKMEERAILNNGDTISYAYGQSIGKYKGLKTITHGGADAGYRTFFIRFPEQRYSIAVFSNYASFNPGSIAYSVADLLLSDEFVAKEKKPQEKTVEEDKENFNVGTDSLNAYIGEYEMESGMIFSVNTSEEELFITATGQGREKFTALSNSVFELKKYNAKVIFCRNEKGEVNEFKLIQGEEFIAKRMKPFDKSAVNLNEFTGSFYSNELSTEYILVVEDTYLIAKHIRLRDIRFKPIKPDTFDGNSWFMSRIEFTRDKSGKINGLKASSGRVQNLQFEKR